MKRLSVNVTTIEIEKPSVGGRGQNVPYVVSVLIDGRLALQLTRANFKQTGQMDAFVAIIEGDCKDE
jgi:hypothetical protein